MRAAAAGRLARDARLGVVGTVGFACALAAAAHVAIPVPGTPVPFTLQPLVVALAGIWLGPTFGTASMMLYLAAGAAGLPVFAPMGAPGVARLLGPTGGYLLAYPVAAWAAGAVAARAPRVPRRVLAAIAAVAIIHLGGLAQLALLTASVPRALALGVTPFLVFDLLKALVAGVIPPRPDLRATD